MNPAEGLLGEGHQNHLKQTQQLPIRKLSFADINISQSWSIEGYHSSFLWSGSNLHFADRKISVIEGYMMGLKLIFVLP